MTRGLNKREKVLVVILAVIIIALGWYKLIFEPVNSKIDEYQLLQSEAENEYTVNLPKLKQMNAMEEELEVLRANGDAKKIPLYDNSKELMKALNKVLTDTDYYDLNFGRADSDDYIVFHNIGLQFNTATYIAARDIIDRLSEDTFVNQISNIELNTYTYGDYYEAVEENADLGDTSVTMTITFYEVASD